MPSRVLRRPRVCRPVPVASAVSAIARLLLDRDDAEFALAHHGVNAGDLPANGTQPRGVLKLAGRRLEAKVEQLLLRLLELLDQRVVVLEAQLSRCRTLGHHTSPTSRFTNRHFMGSLCMARRSASRATGSGTPDSSNITRPGLTFAIHHSGEPLPEPIRVSAGFFVRGRSGKMLIHTLPPRRMCRVMAIRAASIWRLVT